jgi:RNA polymerase sigma factor (sigma-70 family)
METIDAKDHFGLVAKIALEFINKNQLRRGKVEDTYEFSDGLLGLTIAIQKFNSKKCKFSTYAWICIRGKIISGLKKRSRKSGHLKASNNWDFENLPSRNNNREIVVKKIEELIDLMPESPNKIAVVGWFFQKRNFIDIGKELGVGRGRAQQRKNEGIKELKQIAYKIGMDFN